MSFQIVEFPLDTGDNVIHRKVIAPSFKTRDEAIAHVKSIIYKFEKCAIAPKMTPGGLVQPVVTGRDLSSKEYEIVKWATGCAQHPLESLTDATKTAIQ